MEDLTIKSVYIFLISFILLIIFILWIGPLNIFETLKTADWWFILLAVFIHLAVMVLRSVRWGFIIKQITEFRKNFIVDTIASFADNLSPLKTAGEFLSAVTGKKN